MAGVFALTNKYAREAKAQALPPPWETAAHQEEKHPCPDKGQGDKRNKRKAIIALGPEGQNQPPLPEGPGGDKKWSTPACPVSDKWCEIYKTDRHDLTKCRLVKGLAENHQKEREDYCRRDGDGEDGGGGLGFQEPHQAVATIFGEANAPSS